MSATVFRPTSAELDRGAQSARRCFGELSPRELRVLRLLADGYRTSEIARELAYSERTIKHSISALTSRLQLRNRTQAVAIAVREGLI
jgi:DNA-binding NarL/FixJ family response regulator